jgi:hypothetical protein
MTQMSEPHIVSTAAAQANCATRRARSPLARPLHGGMAIRALALAMTFAGCVIPPSLSVDTTDAGLNSPPTITSVRADGVELTEYSDVTFEKGLGTLNLTVYDTDINDTLYPKIFVDYTFRNPTPPRSPCSQAAGDTVMRSSTCDLAGLCLDADIGQRRTMQVLVFDRQVLDVGTPVHQAMPPGGLSTSRTFTLICQAAQ